MKICTKCGAQARDEERFCMKCFSVLPDAVASSPTKTDPVRLIIESNIVSVPVPDSFRTENSVSMAYDTPVPMKIEEALGILTEAISVLETFEAAIKDNFPYLAIKAGLILVNNKIVDGQVPPITKDCNVHLNHAAYFFFQAAGIINKNCSDGNALLIRDKYYSLYKRLLDIDVKGIESTKKDDGKKDDGKKEEDGKAGGEQWHPAVREEIASLEMELERLCPSFKMQAYIEGHDYWQELDDLIGLDSVKHALREHIESYKVYLERKKRHPELPADFKFNCIFKGRPGTGKTTVARIVSGILKSEGILKCGHYIETDMSVLGTPWVGLTPKFARLAALQAVGGVLFYDEAYTLMPKGGNDKNAEDIVDTFTPILSKYGGEIVAVLAGYEDEMNLMLKSVNPGFASRFQKSIIFEDYTSTEMFQIFMMAAERECYRVNEEAQTRLLGLLKIIEGRKDENREYANARTVKSLFGLVRAKASARFQADRSVDPDIIIADDMALTQEQLKSIGAI